MADKNATTSLSLQQIIELLERATHALKEIRHTQSAQEVRDMAEDELHQDPVFEATFQRDRESCMTVAVAATAGPKLPTRQVSTSKKPLPKTMTLTAERGTGFKMRPLFRPINTTPIVTLQPQMNVFPLPWDQSATELIHTLWCTHHSLANNTASDDSSISRSNSRKVAVSRELMRSMIETKLNQKIRNDNNREKAKKTLAKMISLKAKTTAQKHPDLSPQNTSTLKSSSTTLVSEQPRSEVLATLITPADPVEELNRSVDNVYLDTLFLSLPEEPNIEEEDDHPFFKETPPSSPKSQ